MKTFLLFNAAIIFFVTGNGGESLFSSHFIGLHKSEVSELVTQKYSSYKLNTSTINNRYNYLKYEDPIREITLLFFLTDEDECKAIRLMSDYSNINTIVADLNERYQKVDENNWMYHEGAKTYSVNLEEGDWFFTVSIKESKAE